MEMINCSSSLVIVHSYCSLQISSKALYVIIGRSKEAPGTPGLNFLFHSVFEGNWSKYQVVTLTFGVDVPFRLVNSGFFTDH